MGATEVFPHHPYPSSSSSSSSSSLGEESRSDCQGTSSYSSDLVDDATSSSSTSIIPPDSSLFFEARRDGGGPLCELSDLMTHLPIKRGLSRYYSWKSQSFTSLASARSIEDLEKKEDPCAKRLKLCAGRGFEGRSSLNGRGRRSMSYGLNMEARAAAVKMPRKRPSFLATSINRRPPIPSVRTF